MATLKNAIRYKVIYNVGQRNLLKRVRDFIRCCKKTTEEIDSILEDIDDLQLYDKPIFMDNRTDSL